ncbi:MAG TPA: hypothetical protein VGH14_19005 [Solirubrobacterales bacterium]
MPSSRTTDQAAAANEATRLRRLREDARRPISVNLAEGITLSHELLALAATTKVSPKHG